MSNTVGIWRTPEVRDGWDLHGRSQAHRSGRPELTAGLAPLGRAGKGRKGQLTEPGWGREGTGRPAARAFAGGLARLGRGPAWPHIRSNVPPPPNVRVRG